MCLLLLLLLLHAAVASALAAAAASPAAALQEKREKKRKKEEGKDKESMRVRQFYIPLFSHMRTNSETKYLVLPEPQHICTPDQQA